MRQNENKVIVPNQQGFSLIESLIWLVVVTGLIAVIAGVARYTKGSQATYATLADVKAIVIAVNRLYGPAEETSATPYTNITTEVVGPELDPALGLYSTVVSTGFPLFSPRFVPVRRVGVIANAYGGTIGISSNAAYGNDGDSYLMTITGVPSSACADFVGQLTATSLSVAVGTSDNYALYVGGDPPDAATIAGTCTTAATSGTTSVFVADL